MVSFRRGAARAAAAPAPHVPRRARRRWCGRSPTTRGGAAAARGACWTTTSGGSSRASASERRADRGGPESARAGASTCRRCSSGSTRSYFQGGIQARIGWGRMPAQAAPQVDPPRRLRPPDAGDSHPPGAGPRRRCPPSSWSSSSSTRCCTSSSRAPAERRAPRAPPARLPRPGEGVPALRCRAALGTREPAPAAAG